MKLINYFRSVLFCLNFFDLKTALNAPIYVGKKTRLKIGKKSSIIIKGKVQRHMISINENDDSVGIHEYDYFDIILGDNSNIYFNGNCVISKGGTIRLENEANVYFGENCFINKNVFVHVKTKLIIGFDCIFGWNCKLRDFDGHNIIVDGKVSNKEKRIYIGNHVWIGSDCVISKGAHLPCNSILASNSVLNKKFDETGVLYAGIPAKVVKRSVFWER